MISSVANGFCSKMIFILILKSQTEYMFLPGQQLFEPLTDFFVPTDESIAANVIQHIILDVDVEDKIFTQDMW